MTLDLAPAETAERFRKIYEHAPTGIAIGDLSGRIVQCNPAFALIVGFEEAELRGRDLASLVHPDDRTENVALLLKLISRELPSYTTENRYVNKAGQPVWVQKFVSLLPGASTEPGSILVLVTNITERRCAELELRAAHHALQQSEATFRATFENAAVGIAHVSLDGRFLRVNQTLSRITGYPHHELLAKTFVEITHPDDLEPDVTAARRLAAGVISTYSLEKRYLRKDGSPVWVNLTASGIRDASGRLLYFIGVIEDISRRRAAEEEARLAKVRLEEHAAKLEGMVAERTQQLQEMVKELGAFSYSVAHDLRAPLRTIIGFSEILQSDAGNQLSPENQTYLARIARAGKRMDTLITDVLEYSRVSRNDLVIEDLDTDRLVSEVVESLGPGASAAVKRQSPLPPVRASQSALVQCISNIVGNALKFARPGVAPQIVIRAERAGSLVRLWFEDNGIGIPQEHQEKIWRMFERLDARFEGTGVGLSIVKRAVERMGGHVGVDSDVGAGSRFWIELPVAGSPETYSGAT